MAGEAEWLLVSNMNDRQALVTCIILIPVFAILLYKLNEMGMLATFHVIVIGLAEVCLALASVYLYLRIRKRRKVR
jgi:hypothetical protein